MVFENYGARPTKRRWKDPKEDERPSKKTAATSSDLIEYNKDTALENKRLSKKTAATSHDLIEYNKDTALENERLSKKTAATSRDLILIDKDTALEKIYKFRILLPIGSCVEVRIRDPEFMEMPVKEFVEIVEDKYKIENENVNRKPINWDSPALRFCDVNDNVIYRKISFIRFGPNTNHILRLRDGSKEAETYENMWDLTPDTELLMELPEEYTFETAIADLIDNSLQAVWSNSLRERRLISVELDNEKISIFDSGPGMDGTEENSIVKWGKWGASLNRSSKADGVGGKPPYLTPCFGMFGYGGSTALMHLGRRALVCSKTKESEKVFTLYLQKEALLSNSYSKNTWKTDGGIRNPTDDEKRESPHGSFTKVEIFEPRMKGLDTVLLQHRLKDIYFPYVQCDELSKIKTITPVEFEVNGTNLTEIEGGEVAITNLRSCNGPDFILQLHFSQDVPVTSGQGRRATQKANARLKFVYFPIVEGKESIEMILEKLKEDGYGITESYDTFSHVSIRRLGRLLPDARWSWLPFMKPKQQRGDKAHILKRCCQRVKCFIDIDAGFNPTPPKTDLAHHHIYTTALKNFGDTPLEKNIDVNVCMYKDGKQVTLLQLEKQYQEWILLMHDKYDKEVECGEDEPLVVHGLTTLEKKKLSISSDVLRVHKVIPRRGQSWKSGQKVKLVKGAGAGVHKNNVYATLECILLEGFEGDAGGEARLIFRPLAVPEEKGCRLTLTDDGKHNIDIGDSLSLPISIIDRGQCLTLDDADWEKQVERQCQKQPSTIDILSASDCLELGIDGALPSASTVSAGYTPPIEIVAVVRPASFHSGSGSNSIDQRNIVKDNLTMVLQLKYNAGCKSTQDEYLYSGSMHPSSCKNIHGLYVFSVGHKCPDIFQKAGVYTFMLSLRGSTSRSFERKINVKALPEVSSWELLTDAKSLPLIARVGSCFPPISIVCYDFYKNHMPFPSVPQIIMEVRSEKRLLAAVHKTNLDLSSDKMTLTLKDMLVESHELDCIRPSYKCALLVSSKNEDLSTSIPCQVHPGDFKDLTIKPKSLGKKVIPGHTIDELILEMFDGYGNRVSEGLEVLLNVDGFCLVDHLGPIRKVDRCGNINLSGLLKVTGGYGSKVSLFVLLDGEIIFKKNFETEERELRISSEVKECSIAGSVLENIVFVIVSSDGDVDETFHDDENCGQSHTLMIKSNSLDGDDSVKYSFRNGCCTVRALSLPQNEVIACFVATHSRHPELRVTFKVNLLQPPNLDHEINAFPHSYERSPRTLLLQNSPACATPKLEKESFCSQVSSKNLLVLQDSPAFKCVQNVVVSTMSNVEELQYEFLELGRLIGGLEEEMKTLDLQEEAHKQDIAILSQDLLEPLSVDDTGGHGKEQTLELIEKEEETAASIICRILRGDISEKAQKYARDNILGVAALMGSVQSCGLSRILAEYLGEDLMLSVVCKSYSAVESLERYDEYGNVDLSKGLHAIAAKIGISINRRFLVISLEDIRPYVGDIGNDPERKLGLPDPSLPSGITSPGFLGYAVNMINLDADHLPIRIGTCHGLRETLFYRLFGELQVYENRTCMNMARSCIKFGAVSLDGGIMRDGVLSLGTWQSKICFPVISVVVEAQLSKNTIEVKKQIEDKTSDIRKIVSEKKEKAKVHRKAKKLFSQKKETYLKYVDINAQLLKSLNTHN